MTIPLIALPLRPEAREGVPRRMFQNRSYFDAIADAGGAVLPVPIELDEERLRAVYERSDAVCLPGGPDVAPDRYDAAPRDDCNLNLCPAMDTVDLQLALWAVEDEKPLLAICRGMQVLNVALGGTLWQDIGVEMPGALPHRHAGPRDVLSHALEVEAGSRLRAVLGADEIAVNSLHHQGVRDVAAGLAVTARSPDGLVEGVEHEDHRFALGVQCHPEELFERHDWAARIFHELVRHAGA